MIVCSSLLSAVWRRESTIVPSSQELNKGAVTRIYREAVDAVDMASSHFELRRGKSKYVEMLREVPQDLDANPLIVGVIGEIYVVLEPFSNTDLEVGLGKLRVEMR